MDRQKMISGISWLLCGVSVVMALWVTVMLAQSGQAGGITVDGEGPAQGTEAARLEQRHKELVAAIKKDNRFVNPPPPPQPPSQVLGILGDQAYFPNGKWYKVGDTVPPGAKVVAITVNEVTIEWEGSERKLYPIRARIAEAAERKSEGKSEKKTMPKDEKKEIKQPVKETMQEAVMIAPVSGGGDDLDWLDIPEHMKAFVKERWDQLSDEQKTQARKMFENASPEMKDRMLGEMEREMARGRR